MALYNKWLIKFDKLWLIPMLIRLGSVLERVIQSSEKTKLYQKYIVCSNEGYRQNKSSQKDITRIGCDARVWSVLAKSEFGKCTRSYLITIIILLALISCTS
jgi:hypothetical protein